MRESEFDDKLLSLIMQAVGEASVCWENVKHAGDFKQLDAISVGMKLKKEIGELYDQRYRETFAESRPHEGR